MVMVGRSCFDIRAYCIRAKVGNHGVKGTVKVLFIQSGKTSQERSAGIFTVTQRACPLNYLALLLTTPRPRYPYPAERATFDFKTCFIFRFSPQFFKQGD